MLLNVVDLLLKDSTITSTMLAGWLAGVVHTMDCYKEPVNFVEDQIKLKVRIGNIKLRLYMKKQNISLLSLFIIFSKQNGC